jgi:hypothetical protein
MLIMTPHQEIILVDFNSHDGIKIQVLCEHQQLEIYILPI